MHGHRTRERNRAAGQAKVRKSSMTMPHAIVCLDHHAAQVAQFTADDVAFQKVKSHGYETKQHGSAVRTEHEFFGQVCDALQGVGQVLVAGSQTAQSDFRHYVEKHRPQVATHIVGYESVDSPTDNQLVALGREYFLKAGQKAV
jgi:stalled ribosome rescue protein Dom34